MTVTHLPNQTKKAAEVSFDSSFVFINFNPALAESMLC